MISKNVVLQFGEDEIVPIRAVPFVTADIGPRRLASILSTPGLSLEAFVLAQDGKAILMFPKEWTQFLGRLSPNGKAAPDLVDTATLKVLPSSTFVYRENLWRTYEDLFLPDRETLHLDSPGEQQNCMLQWIANIPIGLVDLVFEGFSEKIMKKPVSRADAQDQEILALLTAKGYEPKNLPVNSPGKRGVKAEIRDAIGDHGMWAGTTVFVKAWDRLRKNGDIANN
jgi:hypothetical protein